MYFTTDDLKTIAQWLANQGIRDTQFPQATSPLSGEEQLVIVQNNQNVLVSMSEVVAQLGQYINLEGCLYAGVATTTTVPSTTNSNKIFYIATDAGVYKNFGNIELDGSVVAILKTASVKPNVWEADLTNIRLDAVDIAQDARTIADRALTIAQDTQTQVSDIDNKATEALSLSKVANANANEALEEAKSSIKTSERGKPGGVPILDENGLIPESQLPVKDTILIDSYMSDRTDAAPTANALYQLYLHHEASIVEQNDILNAILDLVSDSTEIGVAPVNITITSAAQDVKVQIICNGGWSIGDLPSGVTASPMTGTGNGVTTLSFAANPSETVPKTGSIVISNSFGKSKTVTFTQQAASTVYVYNLSVTPTSVNVAAAQNDGKIEVVSTKTPHINGVPSGDPEPVDFTVSVKSSVNWLATGSVDPTYYSCLENTLEASRSAALHVAQVDPSGKSIDIPFTQAAATINKQYTFTITPANLSINDDGAGGTYQATITSTLKTTINDKVETTPVEFLVSYSGQANSSWVVYDKSKNTITLPLSNLETAREGAIIFTQQSPTTPVITVPVHQEPAVITWDYKFEYNPTTMNFGNAGGTQSYTVTKSVKQKLINGTPTGDEIYVPWDVQITGTGFSLNKDTNSVIAAENAGTATRSGTLTFTRAEVGSSGNRTIALTQSAGIVTWEYTLSASVNPTSVAALNGTTVLTVTSTKQKYINGKADGNPVAVAWHATSKNGYLSGADTSGSTWSMTENRTESSRSDVLTITQLEEGSKQTTVNVTQVAGTVTYDYTFTVTPASLSFAVMGETKSFTVVSTRQKKINGTATGSPEAVNWSSSVTGSGFSITNAAVTATENRTESARSGTATFTQTGGNAPITRSLSQPAGTVTYEYTFSVSPSIINLVTAGTAQTVTVTSTRQKKINGSNSGSPEAVAYSSTISTGFNINQNSISAPQNNTESSKSGTATFTQTTSGKTATVSVTQAAGVVTYDTYVFEATPTAGLAFPRVGATKSFTVTSTRVKKINGISQGTQQVDYTVAVTGTGFSVNGKEIVAAKNPNTSSRSGSATLTQSGSGTVLTRALSQQGGSDPQVQKVVYRQKATRDGQFGAYSQNSIISSDKDGCIIDGGLATMVGGGIIIEITTNAEHCVVQPGSTIGGGAECWAGLNMEYTNEQPNRFEYQLIANNTWRQNQLDITADLPVDQAIVGADFPAGASAPTRFCYWLTWDTNPGLPLVLVFILSTDVQITHYITVNIEGNRSLTVSSDSLQINPEGGGDNAVTLDVKLSDQSDEFVVTTN